MTVKIEPAYYADVVYIARNMRAADKEEIYPHLFRPTPEDLAAMSHGQRFCYAAFKDNIPVAAWGANERLPKVWQCWMFATDQWPDVALSVTKSIRREFSTEIAKTGAVRLDCWSADGHNVAHRWLETIGFIREATCEDYSADRQTYHCYSITRKRFDEEF